MPDFDTGVKEELKTNGKYFFDYESLGNRTDDIEFMNGSFRGYYHNKNSKYLWLGHMLLDFYDLVRSVAHDFDEYSITEISIRQWEEIVTNAGRYSAVSQEMVAEIDPWMRDVFAAYGCVTILGV